jgi:hypothetical protein
MLKRDLIGQLKRDNPRWIHARIAEAAGSTAVSVNTMLNRGPEKGLAANRKWRTENPEKDRAATHRWRKQHPARYLLSKARGSAKKRGLQFSITLAGVEAMLAPMVCSVSGFPLRWNGPTPGRDPMAPSLDRVNNGEGYVSGNVRVVCWMYNRMKGADTDEQALEVARALVARNPPWLI